MATLAPHVDKLVLYEPPINLSGEEMHPPGFLERLEAMLEAGVGTGDRNLHGEAIGMGPEEMKDLLSSPSWQAMVDSAHTLPRELRASREEYRFEAACFGHLRTPTLLGGDESPRSCKSRTAR